MKGYEVLECGGGFTLHVGGPVTAGSRDGIDLAIDTPHCWSRFVLPWSEARRLSVLLNEMLSGPFPREADGLTEEPVVL